MRKGERQSRTGVAQVQELCQGGETARFSYNLLVLK